jgi:hypothetical protein
MIVLAGIAATAHGQNIYKCTDDSGTIVFSERPCASDAQKVYIDDSQSGISDVRYGQSSSIYPPVRRYAEPRRRNDTSGVRAARKAEIAARKEARRIEKIHDEAQREFDKVIRRGGNSKAAARAANVALSKIDNPRGEDAQRKYKRMIQRGYNSQAAERAANAVLGRPSPIEADRPRTAKMKTPAFPIPSTRGGVYIPTSPDGSQYIPPSGAGICIRQGPNLNCDGVVKPANGVVVEPPNQ